MSRASEELTTVNRLIAETELNLSRGYRIETEIEYSPRLTFCTGTGNWSHSRRAYGGVNFCSGTRPIRRERQVAIDPAAEQRKLANLRKRQAALQGPTQAALSSCQAPT